MPENLGSNLLFYIFAILAALCAVRAVTSPHILRAAVFLMGMLLITAAFYLLLGAEFVAGVQILVYVGGIVVLLVFAVMLTHSVGLPEPAPSRFRAITAFIGAAGVFAISLWAFYSTPLNVAAAAAVNSDHVAQVGRKLLDSGAAGYLLPFEAISLLLLASVIGGIVIARKTSEDTTQTSTEESIK